MGTGRQIADYALGTYDVGGGYIYGTQGIEWTQARQTAMEKNKAGDPNYAESIRYGKKWIGHRVWDCSGLTRQAALQAGASIHHGSNSTYLYDCDHKGKLTDELALPVGAFVFVYKNGKRTHIGTVTGDDEVTEASCARVGVIKSKLHKGKWHEWGLCKGVQFDFIPGGDPDPDPGKRPTLRKGDQGPYVVELQTDLVRLGFDLGKYGPDKNGVDGKFGQKTEDAVKGFQKNHDGPDGRALAVDGVVGKSTWWAIDQAMGTEPGPEPEPEPPKEQLYTVTIPHVSLAQAEELCVMWSGATMEKE